MNEYAVQGCRVEAGKVVEINIYHLSGDMGFLWTPQDGMEVTLQDTFLQRNAKKSFRNLIFST